jgi:Cdc6-like AAA superfamily ATPase
MESIALKESLAIDPQTDSSIFLGPKKEAVGRIIEDMRQTVSVGRLPKKVIVGVFGIGKTHFIHYAMNKLGDVIYPVYVEVPPTHRRSRFTDVYNVVLRRFGKDQVIDLLVDCVKAKSRVLSNEPELSRIIAKSAGDSLSFLLWKFLSGSKLTSSELRALDIGHPTIYEDEAVWVLNLIGDAILRREHKPLVIFFDEFENTLAIQGDSFNMFTEAIRGMVDESSNLGAIFVASGREVADYPATITDEPVKRRIGAHNYITFKDYTKDELVQFMEEVLVYRRHSEVSIKKLIESAKTTEEINGRTFPFTREALELIAQTIYDLRVQGKLPSLRPSDTLNFMNACVQELLATANMRIIDSNFAKSVLSRRVDFLSGEKEVTV